MNLIEQLLGNCDAHLAMIRKKPCTISNSYCSGDVVPAHLVPIGRRGRKKPSFRHYSCVPLCYLHHLEQEGKTAAFNARYNVDLGLYALQLLIETLTGVDACFHDDKGTL